MNWKYFIYLVALFVILGDEFQDHWLGLFEPEPQELVQLESIVIRPQKKVFGVVVDSLLVIESKVRRNQNLAEILNDYNVPSADIYQLGIKSKGIFDLRKIGVNKKYTVICELDSQKTARLLVYEPNPVEFIVFNFHDSINVFKGLRAIDTVEMTLSGTINNSLYEEMMAQNASPQLVNDLVDVFGWQIDFFRIQKGDQFKLIYEETYVEGIPVGLGRILGAYFEHFGNKYYAVGYDQGKGEDFFDENGNSLRKAFLRAPIEYTRISSRYSGSRYHPVLKRYKSHLGTDYVAPKGTPIRSVGDGIVEKAEYGKYNGNFVKIKHNGTYSTQYLHMHKVASGIRPGVRVTMGQTIGYVGNTGLATGNHVCYRFWKNGIQVDALQVYIPPSEPISEENLQDYSPHMDKVIERLNAITIQEHPNHIVADARRL